MQWKTSLGSLKMYPSKKVKAKGNTRYCSHTPYVKYYLVNYPVYPFNNTNSLTVVTVIMVVNKQHLEHDKEAVQKG